MAGDADDAACIEDQFLLSDEAVANIVLKNTERKDEDDDKKDEYAPKAGGEFHLPHNHVKPALQVDPALQFIAHWRSQWLQSTPKKKKKKQTTQYPSRLKKKRKKGEVERR